jgi:acetyl-CoA synthetase
MRNREFETARELLLRHREDHAAACREFRWPRLDTFNWALDWFDEHARGNQRPALTIVRDDGPPLTRTFAELAESSNRVANAFRAWGVRRGDRILVMLGNELPLWETMLAAMKLGAVLIPATTQLTRADLEDRLRRGAVRHLVVDEASAAKLDAVAGDCTRIVSGQAPGWRSFAEASSAAPELVPDGATQATDPLLLYFTSGTTASPKLVLHTHQSYPVGHLTTMFWIGIKEGDVHLNVSSPGWAKHAWSSFFAPWNAGATILAWDHRRFSARRLLEIVRAHGITTLCAPPTVWRMVILEPLGDRPPALREIVSAGEPLNAEIIERVQAAWGITIRDGFGQTETAALIGNSPGQAVAAGAMGWPLPGYRVALLDRAGREASAGEVSLDLAARPLSLMVGYVDDAERTAAAMADGFYRTGDEATRGADGRYTFVARGDDVFKSSDYRISPFELESALLEHAAVAEAAVIPSPDAIRLAVPKAIIVLKPGIAPGPEIARALFAFSRERLGPYKRIRRIEFAALPKTISGKIRRAELRAIENERRHEGTRGEHDYEAD